MISIEVNSERRYSVLIGVNWREELAEVARKFNKVFLIAPETVTGLLDLKEAHSDFSNVHLFSVPDGEQQKTIATLEQVWAELAAVQIGRQDAIVAIGGGATTDLAGFAAATWLRGIEWFAFPTTLAASVDAAIGGKTGINSTAGKNLIGSFYSPGSVFIDTSPLETLNDRDFTAGLAEVIKTGFIADPEILRILEGCDNLSDARMHVEELISRSVAVKAKVVSSDFKEGKLREILNYGHTLGHAIEKNEDFLWRHGEAVSVGLVFAAELSVRFCDLNLEVLEQHRRLLSRFGLPISYSSDNWPQLLDFMRLDKKARSGGLRFIGLSEVGTPQWLENISDHQLAEIYDRISE